MSVNDKLDKMGELLARLDERTERMELADKERAVIVDARLKDQGDRIRDLEKWRWINTGAFGILAAYLKLKYGGSAGD